MRRVAPFVLAAACAHTAPSLAPRPDDVATIDGIVRAYYEVVDVAPDAPRQWDRDRTLYAPWIHFVAVNEKGAQAFTHAQFVADSEPLLRAGFSEKEIGRRVRQYGNIAHVESSYQTLVGTEHPRRSRGVNFLELYHDGARWWIASAVWQTEDDEHPIPPELLGSAERAAESVEGQGHAGHLAGEAAHAGEHREVADRLGL